MTRRLLAIRIVFVLALTGHTYLSLTPSVPEFVPQFDKANHAAAYFAVGLIADWAFPSVGYLLHKGAPLFLYGLLMEILQRYVPGRTFEGLDLVANAAGLLLYAALVALIRKLRPTSLRAP